MIRTIFAPVTGIALALGAATSLQAASPLETWVGQVNEQIDASVAAPIADRSGVAVVSFRRSSDGSASDVTAKADNAVLRAAAVRTAKRLHKLPPLPTGVSADQMITMRLLFGDPGDMPGFEKKRDTLLASAATANRQFAQRTSETRLALLMGPR